ncbi:MAG TPA: helix-turn-helix domain-containing protein [Woeseiaceae bacterium]|nr:helix-turn-helix domain-containing protein [Woeseiaceae bacterium]
MKSYGQFCPVAKAAEVFCERWTALIIRDLACGAERFSELKRGVPLMSPTLLTRRLRQLEQEGIVERKESDRGSTDRLVYRLTAAGQELVPAVALLSNWGQRWARRELAEGEIDLGLLVWALERGVRPDAFGTERTVVQLVLTDQRPAKRRWWFVNENGAVQLCVKDPGFEVDLYVEASLPDAIYIWRGDLSVTRAEAEDRLKVHGVSFARRAFHAWLNLGEWTQVRSQRATS